MMVTLDRRHYHFPLQNNLKYQPGTYRHIPTIVYEMALTNENYERLITDASQKYFNINTDVQGWNDILS